MRLAKLIAVIAGVPAVVHGQLTGGIGPVGQVSTAASTWRTTAQLAGIARFDAPLASLQLEGSLSQSGDVLRLGALSGRQLLLSPALNGFRAITSLEFDQRSPLDPSGQSTARGTMSLSYRRGTAGTWLGLNAERGSSSSLRIGGWRQLSHWLNVAVASQLRRATFGARPATLITEWVRVDSTPSDTGRLEPRTFGDSGSAGRRLSWLETEARFGGRVGRVYLDGAIGWRPPIDSTTREATWFRGAATIAFARNVALSAGFGTTARQGPFTETNGRYATLGVRLSPAALLRPPEMPEITPAVAAFKVERAGDQYVVRVRLPRARVVELSGDFNGWQPIRLSRQLDDSWVIALDLKPGAYRMNLRIDGERWLPPPGVASVDDEFNGKVGLVVVR